MITAEIWRKLDDLIYDIYCCKDSVGLRTVFLNEVAEILPYDAAFFDLKGTYRGKTFYYDPISVAFQKEALDCYYEKYVDKDYVSWALTQPDDYSVYRDSDLISDSARERSSFYREWLEPQGLSHGCGAIIACKGIIYGTVTFARQKSMPDFSDKDMEVLRVAGRHLCLKFFQLYPSGIAYVENQEEHAGFCSHYHLTERENELCHLLYNGVPTREIARLLCISINTVNRHIANVYRKVNVNSRLELMKAMAPFADTNADT